MSDTLQSIKSDILQEFNAILDKNNITTSEQVNPTASKEDNIVNTNSEEDGGMAIPSEEGRNSDSAPYIMNILPNLSELAHRRLGRSLKTTIKIIEEKECKKQLE